MTPQTPEARLRELIALQVGGLQLLLCEKTVELETLQAEHAALKAELEKLKTADHG